MELAVLDLIAIIMTIAGTASAFSLLYAKFIKPIKKVVEQVEKNKEGITKLQNQIKQGDNFTQESQAVLFETLLAVLDGLEQQGANGEVTKTKKKLISYLTKNHK